jgi:hypothetical protein
MNDTPKLLTEEDVDRDIWFGGQKEKVMALARKVTELQAQVYSLEREASRRTRAYSSMEQDYEITKDQLEKLRGGVVRTEDSTLRTIPEPTTR